jgi:hypothetical protein
VTSQQVGFIVGIVVGAASIAFSILIFRRPKAFQDVFIQSFGKPRRVAEKMFSLSGVYLAASAAMVGGVAILATSVFTLAALAG